MMDARRFARALAALFLALSPLAALPQAEQPRRNVGLFLDKVRAGKQVTVAWLGGSLSCGNGASDVQRTSFRALVNAWLRTRYPQSNIRELNASVTGTGSLYGAMRARRDVVEHKPDLVFIEFSAHDSTDPESAVKESLEGVIRQLLAVPQPPEIVLVHAGGAGGPGAPGNASRRAAVEWHESIARYYQVPSVTLPEVPLRPASGAETAHPNDDGHRLLADALIAFLVEQQKLQPSPGLKLLPPPVLSDEMTYGELKPFAELAFQQPWRTDGNKDRSLPSKLLVSDKPGAEVKALYEGTSVGLTFKMGPDGGMIECLIDGKPAPDPLGKIDTYSPTPQIGTRVISGLGQGEHTLTVRVRGEKNAKSSGTQVKLGNLLVGGQRPERL
jgi:lysophospholipase L1-like esterase